MPKSNFCINHEGIFFKNMELALIREEVTKKSICEKTGLSRSTIQNYYKKPRTMTVSALKQIVKITKIPKEELIAYIYEGK